MRLLNVQGLGNPIVFELGGAPAASLATHIYSDGSSLEVDGSIGVVFGALAVGGLACWGINLVEDNLVEFIFIDPDQTTSNPLSRAPPGKSTKRSRRSAAGSTAAHRRGILPTCRPLVSSPTARSGR